MTLLRLFPKWWRTRYGEEFLALLDDQVKSRRPWRQILYCALSAHASGGNVTQPRKVRSWRLLAVGAGLGIGLVGVVGVFVSGASPSAARFAAGLVVPFAIALPVSLVATGIWVLVRHPDRTAREALASVAANALLSVTLVMVLAATLSPRGSFFELSSSIELRPFVEILSAQTDSARLEAIAVLAGNAGLFLVLGLLLGRRSLSVSPRRLFFVAASLAVGIEVAQVLLGTGRPSDITEVLVRAAGIAAGYGAWRLGTVGIDHVPHLS